MAARKLQAEIDRTFKRIAEGVELFEATFDKLKDASANASGPGGNPAQVKKYEADLKSQIKKLQRHRDQIKSWIAGSDIKDKSSLTEQRELIETQMERFKATEKEMKTKAFSKEGLTAAAKMDPKEKSKMETINWISEQVDVLSQQIEQAEAEVETLQAVTKKGKKDNSTKSERLVQLEAHNERRKWHVDKLEQVNRKLENGDLDVDDVIGIKDNVGYYVESNQEEDTLGEDDTFYDDLNLEDEDGVGGGAGGDDDGTDGEEESNNKISSSPANISHVPPSLASKPSLAATASNSSLGGSKARKLSGTSSAAPEEEKEEVQATRPVTRSTRATSGTARKPSVGADSAPIIKPGVNLPPLPVITQNLTKAATSVPTTQPSSLMASHVGIPKLASQPAPQPVRYAAAAAAAAGSKIASAKVPLPTQSLPPPPPPATSAVSTPPIDLPAAVPTTVTPTVPPAPLPTAPEVAKEATAPTPVPSSRASQAALPTAVKPAPQDMDRQGSGTSIKPLAETGFPQQKVSVTSHLPKDDQVPARATTATPTEKPSRSSPMPTRLPQTLSDLVPSYEAARSKSIPLLRSASQNSVFSQEDLTVLEAALTASLRTAPEPSDSDKPKYYLPRNPTKTPAYYPQTSLTSFEDPRIFEKMEVDTLFFVFYYMQGTYQQYLAAKELKKQSWRFHKKYVTWFQRHEEPKIITDDYEQGVYVYFDWEQVWCQRKKADFR